MIETLLIYSGICLYIIMTAKAKSFMVSVDPWFTMRNKIFTGIFALLWPITFPFAMLYYALFGQ